MSVPTSEEISKASSDLYACIVRVATSRVRWELARASNNDDEIFRTASAHRSAEVEMRQALDGLIEMQCLIMRESS